MAKTFNDHLAVIDLETLGSKSDSVILSLGLTFSRYDEIKTFDELLSEGLYVKFDIKEQLDRGRITQDRVVKWWYTQPIEAKKILFKKHDDISLYQLPKILDGFFASKGVDVKKVDFYDRKSFDMTKLQYLFEEELGGDIFWNPNSEFEVATAFRFLGFDRYAGVQVSDIPGAIYHHALHDAAVDHLRLFKCLHSTDSE
jgi:hypothetical protein